MHVSQELVCNYIEFIHSEVCSTGAKFYSLSRNFASEPGISSSRLPLLSELSMR